MRQITGRSRKAQVCAALAFGLGAGGTTSAMPTQSGEFRDHDGTIVWVGAELRLQY